MAPAQPLLVRGRMGTDANLKLERAVVVVSLAMLVAFCAGRADIKSTADDPARVDISQLWVAPADLETRNLVHESGGETLAPDPTMTYEFVAADTSGYSPGYDVRDREGIEWSVKLGKEAQPEVAASRLLWAIGFHQPPVYVLSSWQMTGEQSGAQGLARFRRDAPGQKAVGDWSWYQNPFADLQAFKGLIVANVLLNNWDWKTSNNRMYDQLDADGRGYRYYVVRDLGASLGKTSYPRFLRWMPMRGLGQGSRNDLTDFEEQGFIAGVEGTRVKFDYSGIHQRLLDTLTVTDVVWTCALLNRLSDAQWHDAFRAAGYSEPEQQRFVAKLKAKVREGLALKAL